MAAVSTNVQEDTMHNIGSMDVLYGEEGLYILPKGTF